MATIPLPASPWLTDVTMFDATAAEDRLGRGVLTMLDAAGVVDDVLYFSTPITGGLRWFEFLARIGDEADRMRRERSAEYRAAVLAPNTAEAAAQVSALRAANPGRHVLNPAALQVAGASQNFYNLLWSRLIVTHVSSVVVADRWAFSSGARMEAVLALQRSVPVRSVSGETLTMAGAEAELAAAFDTLLDLGLDRSSARAALRISLPRALGE